MEEIQPEEEKTFEGNYIESFQKNDSDDFYPGSIISWEKKERHVLIYAEDGILELSIHSPRIIKFRYANDGYFEDDFSYAISDDYCMEETSWRFEESEESLLISTDLLNCHIYKKNMCMCIKDKEGNILAEDEKGYHWKEEKRFGGNVVISTFKCSPDDKYYGLGDKTGKLNLKGTRKELWGTDCYGYGNDTDPVYKNIPFFVGLKDKLAYGVFMDNTFRSFFDFGHERPEALSFWAQGGEMRYYFIYGPEVMTVAKEYARLTGSSPLPPKWALGYHQSKWSYYPESTVRELAATFREKKVPCDVIHLDIDYMQGYRCFTWNESRFPDPKKMISDLEADGFKTICIIDPGIKIDKYYSVYQQGVHNRYFCKRMDGAFFKGSVWPGPCHFPDFTKAKVRDWWAGLFKGLIGKDGVHGIWNDMNEPAVFEEGTFPRDIRHNYDGHACSHRKAHNVYGMQMVRATNEGQKRFSGNKRVFTITRSAYAGTQRYSSAWTGDNVATWEHLQIANTQCQRLNLSGMSFVGSDVGGFIGSPDGELYTRWIQMAVFHPFFRTHSSGDHGDKEPWVFGDDYLKIIRRFIEFRYELMPYLYSTFRQHVVDGSPILRSLFMVDQENEETWYREEEFMMGDHILICPITQKGSINRRMYLPTGNWIDFWSGKEYAGKKEIEAIAPIDQIPMKIRKGAVLPLQPPMQYVDEFEFEALKLHVYSFESEVVKSQLYEDDGLTYDFEKGSYCLRTYETIMDDNEMIIKQNFKGEFESSYTKFRVIIHGVANGKYYASVDGAKKVELSKGTNIPMVIEVPKHFKEIRISQ
ncbi:MAG: glycoside hydrolase family 31 protein [Cyclobacteriaceae bacterium]|nr:glycoside hydrolase family 31 protein [Cyclobacteriaceae bacterium]MCH8515707.1 glycoside hydrolase family 31 protein [Cyclobacteriaceae bacterium]